MKKPQMLNLIDGGRHHKVRRKIAAHGFDKEKTT